MKLIVNWKKAINIKGATLIIALLLVALMDYLGFDPSSCFIFAGCIGILGGLLISKTCISIE